MYDSISRPLPPWRAFPATVGRWLSSACVDLPVPTAAVATVTAAASVASSAIHVQSMEDVSVVAARRQVDRFLGYFQTGGAAGEGASTIPRTQTDAHSGMTSADTTAYAVARGVASGVGFSQRCTVGTKVTGFVLKTSS